MEIQKIVFDMKDHYVLKFVEMKTKEDISLKSLGFMMKQAHVGLWLLQIM